MLKATAYTKYSNVQGDGNQGVRIQIYYYDHDRKYISVSPAPKLTGTSEQWVPLSVTGSAPNGAAYAAARLFMRGQGEAWFDRLHLYAEEP
jgi:hypothetical protein